MLLLSTIAIHSYGQNRTQLKEVVVRPNLKKAVLGTMQKRADYGHGGNVAYPGYQTAFFIPSGRQSGFIDRVGIYIYHKHTFLEFARRANKLQLYLYAINEKGLPGKALLAEPITIQPRKNTYWHWVDIAEQHIVLPAEGVFAAVGWQKVTQTDTGPYVGMTNECDTCSFYVYRFPEDKPVWQKVNLPTKGGESRKQKRKDAFYQNLMVKLEVSVK